MSSMRINNDPRSQQVVTGTEVPAERTRSVQRKVVDGVDGARAQQKIVQARMLSSKTQLKSVGELAHLPGPRLADLVRSAAGAAASWKSFASMTTLERDGFSLGLRAGYTLALTGSGRLVGPTVVSLETVLAAQARDPQAFAASLSELESKALRRNPTSGELEFNPYLLEPRADWQTEEGRAADERDAKDGRGGGAEGEASDQRDEEDEELPLVALVDDPASEMPAVASSAAQALKLAVIPTSESVRQNAIGNFSAFVQSVSGGLENPGLQNPGPGGGVPGQGGGLPGDVMHDPNMTIEELLMLFMMSAAQAYEDTLRGKMQEQVNAEAAAAAGDGKAKSAVVVANEVQFLMQQWKQMNDLVSNLSKTMHDMAMTPIRNLR
jgi:hypothetical protein